MRTGKTHEQVSLLAKSLNEDKSVLVAGIKNPKDYIDRLFKDFGIAVITEPHYVTRNYEITFEETCPFRMWESGGESKLTGYEFRKVK